MRSLFLVISRQITFFITTSLLTAFRYPNDLDPNSDPFKELIEAHMDVYRDCVEHAKILAKLPDS